MVLFVGADALHRPKARKFRIGKIKRNRQLTHIRVDVGIDPYGFYYRSRKYRGIVTGGNPQRGPHQSALHYGITATGSYYVFNSLCGAPLVRNDKQDTNMPG